MLELELPLSEQLIRQLFIQRRHLISKAVVKKYGLLHPSNYDFKSISQQDAQEQKDLGWSPES